MTSPEALWRWLRQWRHEHLHVDRLAVLHNVDEGGQLGPRFAFMVVMSCGIAMLGLLQNSVAVIIGAMLISPLMGPIVELGMSLATFDFRSLRDALKTLAVGVGLSLLIAICIVRVSPLQEPTAEILARTEPTLFDLLVAVFSGLAGAYATITRKGETIVGVAIATALMPPLAVVGFGIAVGNASIAAGAAFLFMTNLLAIALSVTIMARWYRFGGQDTPRQTAWQAVMIVGTFIVLSVPLGLALRDIAARGLADRAVRNALDASAREGGGRVTTLRVDRSQDALLVDAVLLTPRHRGDLTRKLERQLEAELGRPVQVELREVLTADEAQLASEQATLAQLRDSVASLQTAAQRAASARNADDRADRELRDRALAQLGDWETLAGGHELRWRLKAGSGIDLAGAHALETNLSAAAGNHDFRVIPALQPLPAIVFADDASKMDATGASTLRDIAWALQRWQSAPVIVEGCGIGDGRLASARMAAVTDALQAQGIAVAVTRPATAATTRARLAEEGHTAIRSVYVRIAAP